MPNVLNEKMLVEIEGFLKESEDCVVVDFTGMPVSDAEQMRNRLRDSAMKMRVLKTSLARIAARNLGFENVEQVFSGSSAVVYGGESVAAVARTIKEITKGKQAPKVRGGLLERQAIGPAEVDVLASLPTRKELLGQVLGTIIAPLSGFAGAAQALLSAVPSLVQALEKKTEEGS